MGRQLPHTLSSLLLMPHSTLCSEVLECIFASVAMALNPASHGEHAGFPSSLEKRERSRRGGQNRSKTGNGNVAWYFLRACHHEYHNLVTYISLNDSYKNKLA